LGIDITLFMKQPAKCLHRLQHGCQKLELFDILVLFSTNAHTSPAHNLTPFTCWILGGGERREYVLNSTRTGKK